MKYIMMIVGIFLTELGIKNRVEQKGRADEEKPVLRGILILRKYHNNGAFLNLGEKKKIWVAVCSVVLTSAVTVLFVLSLGNRGNTTLRTGLALLLGGAFSNTYDRLKRKYVVDYFSFGVKWKPFRQVVFNLADFCIMIGALVAALAAGGE
ncbi:MAG: signal peptidase II [Lachnospiraceae bacterium]|nr:signal peptidase II [Lachnospiraceae bacterium]